VKRSPRKSHLPAALVWLLAGCSVITEKKTLDGFETEQKQSENLILVTVAEGFERPGSYRLPRGCTLGELVDLAGIKRAQMFINLETTMYALRISSPAKSGTGETAQSRLVWINYERWNRLIPLSSEDRAILLRDGDQIRRTFISW